MEDNTNNFGERHFEQSSPKKTKTNGWKVATFVLGILLIVSVIAGSSISSIGVSGNAVATDAVDFINTNLLQGQATATLDNVEKEKGLVKATISIMGQQTPVYITNDGEMMFLQAIPLTDDIKTTDTTNTQQNSPTATVSTQLDKPEVELFVMSHCPYGTQIEKGILPVVETLGDKIDFKVKFVYYAMHGDKEVYEELNQYCIQKEQPDKYLDYLYCFLEDGDGERCLSETGIDTTALEECTKAADEEYSVTANFEDQASWLSGKYPLFDIYKADNEKYGVGGSPTLVINGETVSSGRDSNSLLAAICSGFTEAPAECDTVFEEGAPGAGFGWDTTSATNAAAAGCGA